MKRLAWIGLFLAAFAGHAAAAAAMKTTPAISDPAFRTEALAAHNGERKAVGVPPLIWSNVLAVEAQIWATKLAKEGKFAHDRNSRYGENLAGAGVAASSVSGMVQLWLSEKPRFRKGARHPGTSTTGNWMDVGHYTAIVWKTTTHLGCAVARGKTMDILVCRYSPPGNVTGHAAY